MTYPYILNTGRLREFLSKIRDREIGVPKKLRTKDLPALGYTSSADRPIVRILKFINFLSTNNEPTDNFINFRSKELSGRVMAECIKSAYRELFELYPDAYQRDPNELADFFSTKTTAGEKVITAMVNTFRVLCEFANFKTLEEAIEVPPEVEEAPPTTALVEELPLQLVVNIQIQLPLTENVEVYDKIFEALRKHLIIRER